MVGDPGTVIFEARAAAASAGLRYASTDDPGISRRRAGRGFVYRDATGRPVDDPATLARIKALVIPPAWRSVWICADENGHLQAVGSDEKDRRQYRYHDKFRDVREAAKFEHMTAFAEALPALRARIAEDMARPGLGRERVLATVAHLLETTMIRVGNAAYARENKSYGLTTLLNKHVRVEGSELKFHFKGKSGKVWRLGVRDRRIARIVRGCQELPGQQLFQYLDDQGERQAVTSADVNAYLKEATGADITAKDFRTWTGTVQAALALTQLEAFDTQAGAKRNVTAAISLVAERLGNTPTICRKCYVHPAVLDAYLDGGLLLEIEPSADAESADDPAALTREETAVLSFLRDRAAMPAGADARATPVSSRRAS